MINRPVLLLFLITLLAFGVAVYLLQDATPPIRQIEKTLPDDSFPR